MAKRSSNSRSRTSNSQSSQSSSGRRGRPRKSNSSAMNVMSSDGSSNSSRGRKDYLRMMKNLSDRTAFRYAVGGMGVFLLGRLAVKLSDRYPQISNYFKEGMEEIEGRLNSFRGEEESGAEEARH